MMKLIDIGTIDKYGGGEAVESPVKESSKKIYPTLYLDKAPEELMSKEIGKLCRLEIVVKVTSKSIDERDNKTTKSMHLEVQKMGLIGSAGKLDKKEYLALNPTEREAYDSEQIYSK